MPENKEEMLYDDPSKTFYGVYFVLLGFDSTAEEKIRSKLVDGGGVDVGRYGPDCTHVIVGKLVYDDPVCVAARKEGKTLVTGLWVDHSSDIGMPVDPASIMYRPLRDMNGIPGASSLIVCLTGYQRQDREDIMTMVGLMGAKFSKPLVANKVSHLICYKFEGEKYELAKKMKRIKLVNHRWLEDCLRTWELLPEADYDKSGHELETMEAQAKDSEDEVEDVAKKQHGEGGTVATPRNSRCALRSPSQTLVMMQGASRNVTDVGTSSSMSDVGKTNEILLAKDKEMTPSRNQLKQIPNRCFEISESITPGSEGKISCGASLNSLTKPSISENIGSDLISASKTEMISHPSSASTLDSMYYSRRTPSRGSLPLDLGLVKSNAGNIPMVDIGNVHTSDTFNVSPSKIEPDRTIFNGEHTPNENFFNPEDAEVGKLLEKRKLAVSSGSTKLQKMCHDSGFSLECAFGATKTETPHPPSSIQGPQDTTIHHSPQNNHLGVNADLDPSPENISGIFTPAITKECSEVAPQTSLEKLKSTSLDSKIPQVMDILLNRPDDTVDAAKEPPHGPQNLNVSSPGTERLEVQKSDFAGNVDFPTGGDNNSRSKPLKRKLLSRKTFGSKPSFGRGKSFNQKGSIYMNKKVLPEDSAIRSIQANENEDVQRFVDSETLMVSSNCNVDQAKNVERMSPLECGNQASSKTGLVENETEASEDKENGLDAAVCEGISGDIHTPNAVNASKKTDGNDVDMSDKTLISGTEDASMEVENVASDKKSEPSESNLEDNAGGEKKISTKKRPFVETKKKKLSPVTKVANLKKGAKCKEKPKKSEGKNEKGHLADKIMSPRRKDTGKVSVDMEKENRPVQIGDNNSSLNKQQVGKVTPNSGRKPTESGDGIPDVVSAGQILKEPVWFILSGHKLQRKEFQQVIGRLKGRLCRDTHQWSYQATHFIVPDPIRRTEKFFAAAASGRWILKTDYLTACNEAGKFLAEEPYEWHKNGLSEDGAINLEAPRKWRLIRERTGHGALYGTRIIIYGDCIVPPLDTLKRVVRAGDGTILATSPPYTRFLQSDIDFAIVSPGMPRVDIWIQEFLRHEIPCVLADYLVEYVCKPGYSLDRHVQYNTHAWAEKSLKKLENRMNEIVEDMAPQNVDSIADIPCQVCGSCDRGEVMLICGDEGGSRGCGIGTHIDCCDPPLQEIPEEDWFCSKCSSKSTKKNSRKLTSTSKRKS